MLHSSWLALSSLPWSAPSATRPASHQGESVQTGSNLQSYWLALSSLPWSAPSATRPASHPGESGVQTGSNMRFYSIGRRAKIWRGKICNPIGCLVTVQYAIPLASAVKSAITLACVVKCALCNPICCSYQFCNSFGWRGKICSPICCWAKICNSFGWRSKIQGGAPCSFPFF